MRLQGLFLRTGSESVATLHKRLANCTYLEGEEIFAWNARLDGIEVEDLEKKHRAMSLLI